MTDSLIIAGREFHSRLILGSGKYESYELMVKSLEASGTEMVTVAVRRLIDAGAAAVMPLAAPIGSGLGIQNVTNLKILREQITEVPLIVDAGVGTASDATMAMELGVDGILMNTGIAGAREPVAMA